MKHETNLIDQLIAAEKNSSMVFEISWPTIGNVFRLRVVALGVLMYWFLGQPVFDWEVRNIILFIVVWTVALCRSHSVWDMAYEEYRDYTRKEVNAYNKWERTRGLGTQWMDIEDYTAKARAAAKEGTEL